MHSAARTTPLRLAVTTRPARTRMALAPGAAVSQHLGQPRRVARSSGTVQHAALRARADRTPGLREERFQEVTAAVAEYMRVEGKWPSRGTKIAGVGAGQWLWQLRSTVQQGTAAPARVKSLVSLASILNNAVLAYTWTMDTTWERSAALASGDAAGAAVGALLSAPSTATDQQFEASVAQATMYRLLMGTFPREQECLLGRPVGRWLCALRADVRLGDLSDSRLTAVKSAFQAALGQDKYPDAEAPALFVAWAGEGAYFDLRWSQSLYAVCAFVRETGRLPSQSSSDTAERQLGTWVTSNRQAFKMGEKHLSSAREQRLDAMLGRAVWGPQKKCGPRPCHVADLRHLDVCAAVGIIPPSVVLGLTAESWASQLAPFCDADAADGEIWTASRKLASDVTAADLHRARAWLGTAYALCAYVRQHKRLPACETPPLRVACVDCVCDEGQAPVACYSSAWQADGSDVSLATRVASVSAAVPYRSCCAEAADSTEGGINLAGWLTRVRKDAGSGKLSAAKVAVLDSLLEGLVDWRISQRAVRDGIAWQQYLDDTVRFLQMQGRLPKANEVLEGSDSSDGHPVGKWLFDQRQRAHGGKMPPSQLQDLAEKLPGWE